MNTRAEAAKTNEMQRESFIRDMEKTILRIASKACGRFVTKSDDEWSIALFAFNKAIDSYSGEKGDYAAYSKVLIDRALIDYRRSEKRYDAEVLYSPEVLEGEDYGAVYEALSRESAEKEEKKAAGSNIKGEIDEINDGLRKYGFSFYDVAKYSPKTDKTKEECGKAISYILSNEELKKSVIGAGKVPIKPINAATGVSSFLMDRHRKYIIMAVVILNGDYPMLADYLKYIKR